MAWNIQNELKKWGPEDPPGETPSLANSEQYCKKLALGHYENFPVVSWALPKVYRKHFYHIYAFCRWADDLADEIPDKAESLELLDWWESELEKCYLGDIRHPVMLALSETIQASQIPQKPFLDLVSAFKQDQTRTRYQTFDDLLNYCNCSANPVGRLILYACNEFTEEKAILSDHICTGLQLTNFWQDVTRDLKMGRIYIPAEDLSQFECSESDLAKGISTSHFRELMKFEVNRTREFFEKGKPLISQLSGRIQMDIDLFLLGGLKILDKIERIDFQVLEERPAIHKTEFSGLFIKALTRSAGRLLK